MNKNKSLKITIGTLGLFIVLFFVLQFFIYKDISKKNYNTSSLANTFSQQNEMREYINSSQKNFLNYDDDIKVVNNFIISKDGDVDFIENLESLAVKNGLTAQIDSLVLVNEKDLSSKGLTILKIKTKIEGSWINTARFLSQVENMPFKLKIDNFSLIKTGIDNTWQGIFEISVLKYL
jgi:hypothetical protein